MKLSLATSIAESSGGTQVFGLGGSVMRHATEDLNVRVTPSHPEILNEFSCSVLKLMVFKIIIEDHPWF